MNPVRHNPDRRMEAYLKTGKIGVDDLPLVKHFNTLDELIGFVNGVVGRSNFKITKFKAIVRVEA